MSNYVLQIHGRDLDINVSSRSVLGDRHTGYDLIEYGDDGSIIKIQTLDLIKNNSNGKIEILFTESFDQQPIVFSDGSQQIWHNKMDIDGKVNNDVTPELAEKYHFKTAQLITGQQALEAFNWIHFHADMVNAFTEAQIGIDYSVFGPNCNTWTNTVSNFIPGVFDVFENIGGKDDYRGSWSYLTSCTTGNDLAKSQYIDNMMTQLISMESQHDMNITQWEPVINYVADEDGNLSFFCEFANCTMDGRTFNIIFDDNNGKTINCGLSNVNYLVKGALGNDVIYGNNGNDVLIGENNDDILRGGSGNDYLFGDSAYVYDGYEFGNDKLYGGTGNDILVGGRGNDEIYAGEGLLDEIYCGDGNDRVYAEKSETGDGLTKAFLGGGDDYYKGSDYRDMVDGGTGNLDTSCSWRNIDRKFLADATNNRNEVYLYGGDDIYRGGDGMDYVDAGDGDDTILSGGGDDEIWAGIGSDFINAGTGNNHIHCGEDNDMDTIRISNDAGFTDYIYDFNPNIDVLNISGSLGNVELIGNNYVLTSDNNHKIVLNNAANEYSAVHLIQAMNAFGAETSSSSGVWDRVGPVVGNNLYDLAVSIDINRKTA